MNFILLLAAGLIAGVSVKRSIDLRRRRGAARSWLASPLAPAISSGHAQSGMASIVLDRLEQIAGFEPLYARRLNANGILTYAEMAKLSPAALQSLVAPDGPFNLPIDRWLAQAGRLAERVESR